ncbi:CAP domain-containing protein [Candidatus Micrarchaeota archaeon]|nr:CAP domain-containing protein [Candidatus Micrarchaeota archaeon]MBU1930477.1 CAP domain-containing protein [Candidatus Micrarchaeota archaeon]
MTKKKQLRELINAGRTSTNAPTLQSNDFLNNQAQTWSDHSLETGTLEHSDWAPENVATFYYSEGIQNVDVAQQFFNQWNTSTTGHKEIMLSPSSTQIGIGISCNTTTCYATAQFGRSE